MISNDSCWEGCQSEMPRSGGSQALTLRPLPNEGATKPTASVALGTNWDHSAPNLSQNNPGLLPQCRLAPPPAIGFTNSTGRGSLAGWGTASNPQMYGLAGRLALHTLVWASKNKGQTRNPATSSWERLLAQWGLAVQYAVSYTVQHISYIIIISYITYHKLS